MEIVLFSRENKRENKTNSFPRKQTLSVLSYSDEEKKQTTFTKQFYFLNKIFKRK